ncbi:MAG: hypothetical protein AAF493_10425 [Pseudomonadota bacterium]
MSTIQPEGRDRTAEASAPLAEANLMTRETGTEFDFQPGNMPVCEQLCHVASPGAAHERGEERACLRA